MTPEITPQQLHITAGLLVAVLAVLFVLGKIGSKFLDDWWEKTRAPGSSSPTNGNGDTKRVCFMGEGAAEKIADHIDGRHEALRDMIHQNHAAVITILDRLARTLEESKETTRGIETSIEILREILRARNV